MENLWDKYAVSSRELESRRREILKTLDGFLKGLERGLKNQLSGIKGFSERNMKWMTQFFREDPGLFAIGQPPVAQLPKEPEGEDTTGIKKA